MGDANAWNTFAHTKVPQNFPSKPETLWGERHDPKSNHATQTFERMKNSAALDATFADIAEASDVGTLAKTCPSSARFKRRAEAATKNCRRAQ